MQRAWLDSLTKLGQAEESYYQLGYVPIEVKLSQIFGQKFWLDQSDSLMYRGKAEGLIATQNARMPAFFEHANPNLPKYA